MNQTEITKLVTFIEENLRASPSSGLPFVDSRSFRTRLLSKQNHVVFGRRGSGKTTLISSTKEPSTHLDIYLNLEDFKDITFPNIVIYVLHEMFNLLNDQISNMYPWYKFSVRSFNRRRRIKSVCTKLSNLLHEPDQETQEVSTQESRERELSGSMKSHGGSSGGGIKGSKKTQIKRSLPKSKIEYLKIELTTYKKLLTSLSSLFPKKPIFLLLDDFYFVPKSTQPDLLDYFHRLTKGTELFLKVATIRHRSKLYRRESERYVGVELSHDIFEVDMDYSLDNFDDLQNFMRKLLETAIEQSKSNIVVDDIFAGEGFSQLCLASGGVPRDFLSLFVTLANKAVATGSRIGKVDVTDAAISNIGSKLESMKKDSGSEDAILEDYISKIKRFVYTDKRTNAFLIAKEDLESDSQAKQAIRELVDLRLVHLVDHNTSKAASDGRRYEGYILDIGLYDNPRPRSFTQIEPGQRDDKARKDELRAAPLLDIRIFQQPIESLQKDKTNSKSKPKQLELSFQ